MAKEFTTRIRRNCKANYNKSLGDVTMPELYQAASQAAMHMLSPIWQEQRPGKEAAYLSAEFLLGRVLMNNLYNLGLMDEFEKVCEEAHVEMASFEELPDPALGNGGLGRLAACFLDSAATNGITLNGYGIRYKYGLFAQEFKDGFQVETLDDWGSETDPWSIRREEEKVRVDFAFHSVYAVPYDMPIVGYGGKWINTLRLWQAEPLEPLDMEAFNKEDFLRAMKDKNEAEIISMILYPSDSTSKGKILRLKQQYFFASATIQDLVRKYRATGRDFRDFDEKYAIQLNDTHPVIAILEFMRILLTEEGMTFEEAFDLTKRVFSYTNHTVMAEALEVWNQATVKTVAPQIMPVLLRMQRQLQKELAETDLTEEQQRGLWIKQGAMIHMANLAVYATHCTNGVAQIHTEILKKDELKDWYHLYPERFQNKTNGITQRRWLGLCNPELADFITRHIGTGWLTDLTELKRLSSYAQHDDVLKEFDSVKRKKKEQLADYIQKREGIGISPDFLFDVQIKRLHEYKRQLLNAFSILDIYFGIKEGRIKNFTPTLFLFGAKAAPGYRRAKAIIKYINEVAKLIDGDEEVRDLLQVVFVTNYNVSYAEKIIPAADVSEQISTAGTEASGTSNMKLMLNGAVTLGTYDGANIEIVEQAGEQNNYIFGARVEDLAQIKDTYDPKVLYEKEPRIRRVVDTLIDGTVEDGGTGMFRELYDSLLEGASYHRPDAYYLLLDFLPYVEKKLEVNRDYGKHKKAFSQKAYSNMISAGIFSSDRTISQYAEEIWGL